MHRRTLLVMAVLILLAVFAGTSLTYAYDQHQPEPLTGHAGAGTSCDGCHPAGSGSCAPCHFGDFPSRARGPTAGTPLRRTAATLPRHPRASGPLLLPGATVAASCCCHDGTGGKGVYGTIAARGLSSAGARHRIDTTNSVPGGDAASGGAATMAFGGPGGHAGLRRLPFARTTRTPSRPFTLERRRTYADSRTATAPRRTACCARNPAARRRRPPPSTAPTGASPATRGASSGGAVHNHPVESLVTRARRPSATTTSPSSTSDNAHVASPSSGTLAHTNRGYLMPMPRTAQQGGHRRSASSATRTAATSACSAADGATGDAAPFSVTRDRRSTSRRTTRASRTSRTRR